MGIVAAGIYWVIVALWLAILATVIILYLRNRRTYGTTRVLLAVVGLDTLRNIFENSYFGLFFGSQYGILPAVLRADLSNPILLILPKLANIGSGCLVLGILLLRWLPAATRERQDAKRHAEYLHELATTDGLTGLSNRRHFLALLEMEWQRSQRYRHPLSLLMVDIDHFKRVNDRYGHDVGDEVIARVAELCAGRKRSTDIAARLGGEEFAILLLETPHAAAQAFAERLRDAVAATPLATVPKPITATVSIGISDAGHAQSIAELLKQADTALYTAKHAGRNRVCSFSPEAAAS